MTRVQTLAFATLLAVFAGTWIAPRWPVDQALHSSLTVLAMVLLWRQARRDPLPDLDVCLIVLFLCVHSLASRWLYSNVPYDAWGQALLGVSINEVLGWHRNHFDRLVHFLFGVCLTPALTTLIARRVSPRPPVAFWLAVAMIIVAGQVYEWLEWGVAVALSPEDAEAYNGQQGDMWDAHKDTLLAALGSLVWFWRKPA